MELKPAGVRSHLPFAALCFSETDRSSPSNPLIARERQVESPLRWMMLLMQIVPADSTC